LSGEEVATYWLAITQIEAQELLLALRVAGHPHTKKEVQRRLHREWYRLAYPVTEETTEVLSTKAFAEKLKAALHG